MPKADILKLFTLISGAYPGPIAYLDSKFKFQYVNDQFWLWFGIMPDEIIGKSFIDIFGEDTFLKYKNQMLIALSGNRAKFTISLKHKNMGIRTTEQILDPDFAEDGTVKGFIAMVYDISERIAGEEMAKSSEQKIKNLIETMPQLMWIADHEGGMTYVNSRWTHLTNTSLEANLGYGWLSCIHEEDRFSILVEWKEAVKSKVIFETKYRLKTTDGMFRWHLVRAAPMQDQIKQTLQWVGTTTDIHDQKEIEDNLSRLFQLNECSSDFIGMCDLEGKCYYLNEAGKSMLGLDSLECIESYQIEDFFFHHGKCTQEKSILKRTTAQGFIIDEMILINLKTKAETSVHLSSFITYHERTNDITGFGIIARDLTEIKNKENSLKDALATRDHFLSIASHELKTPLMALKLQAQIYLRDIKSKKDIPTVRHVRTAEQTNKLVVQLTRLIDDMLDVSRIKTGKLLIKKEETNLGIMINSIVSSMKILFESDNLPPPNVEILHEITAFCDQTRITQVITNLIINAFKYGKGSNIEIKVYKNQENAVISIKDYGPGISNSDLHRIFDRYERAVESNETNGLGLGLFISREIVELHQGRIWVESQIGNGSTFYFEIPIGTE